MGHRCIIDAIILSRFDAYTVALAHHVIVMWFLKCRLADRQNFVYFIIRSLNHNLVRYELRIYPRPFNATLLLKPLKCFKPTNILSEDCIFP